MAGGAQRRAQGLPRHVRQCGVDQEQVEAGGGGGGQCLGPVRSLGGGEFAVDVQLFRQGAPQGGVPVDQQYSLALGHCRLPIRDGFIAACRLQGQGVNRQNE